MMTDEEFRASRYRKHKELVAKAAGSEGLTRLKLIEEIAGLWIELRSGSLWDDAKDRAAREVADFERRERDSCPRK